MNRFDCKGISYKMNSNVDGVCIVTLPYDEGFTVYVDRKKVDTRQELQLFLSFYIDQGEHDIEIKYMPRGLVLGAILSICGLFFLMMTYMYRRRK